MERLLLVLAIIFISGRLLGEIAERLGQPAVIGEIIAGVVVGPALLDWVPSESEPVEILAELGAIFLLFMVGLEASLYELRKTGGRSASAAAGGIVLPFALGWGLMRLVGYSGPEALFVGTALVATSVAVTARVLRDRGKLKSKEAQIILGAAVIDDVLALLILGVVAGTTEENFSLISMFFLAVEAIAFLAVLGWLGPKALGRALPRLRNMKLTEPVQAAAIAIVLLLAAAATRVGLAAIIGAFLAGLILSQAGKEHELEEKIQPIVSFLSPFFFVHVGTLVNFESLISSRGAALVAGLTLVAVAGKLLGSGLPALPLGRQPALIIGLGMVPRGEVGVIVASLGLSLGVIEEQLYAVVVAMAVLTTLLSPGLLSWALRKPGGRFP